MLPGFDLTNRKNLHNGMKNFFLVMLMKIPLYKCNYVIIYLLPIFI